MNTSTEILKNSFLNELLNKGFRQFHYSHNELYTGVTDKYIRKSTLQPSREEFIELINKLAETVGRTFDANNHHLHIGNSPIFVMAKLDSPISGDFFATIIDKNI